MEKARNPVVQVEDMYQLHRLIWGVNPVGRLPPDWSGDRCPKFCGAKGLAPLLIGAKIAPGSMGTLSELVARSLWR